MVSFVSATLFVVENGSISSLPPEQDDQKASKVKSARCALSPSACVQNPYAQILPLIVHEEVFSSIWGPYQGPGYDACGFCTFGNGQTCKTIASQLRQSCAVDLRCTDSLASVAGWHVSPRNVHVSVPLCNTHSNKYATEKMQTKNQLTLQPS